jgi:cell wall-associated NlpC family hydrolase
MSAEDFVAAARQLKGARWRHRGRKPWAVDCIGVLKLSGDACGLNLRDQIGYGREPWEDRLRSAMREHFGDPVPPPWRPGDVPLIRWGKGEPSHVGILGDHPDGGLTLIHAHNLHGVVENSLTGNYARCVIEVYRPWRED